MALITDPYTATPGATIAAAEINARIQAIITQVNGNVDAANILNGSVTADKLVGTDLAKLGLSDSTNVRRGKSNVATTQSLTSTTYGLMPTPDRVQGIVLPTDGLIVVGFQGTWQSSVGGAGAAAIFIGVNQLKVASESGAGAPVVQEVASPSLAATDTPLASGQVGLVTATANNPASDVTTGQVIGIRNGAGGPCYIFAAAGTYDISVQFKASSGSVTVKNRKLWVWTIGF